MFVSDKPDQSILMFASKTGKDYQGQALLLIAKTCKELTKSDVILTPEPNVTKLFLFVTCKFLKNLLECVFLPSLTGLGQTL